MEVVSIEKPTVFGCWYPSDCGFGGLTVVLNTVAQLHYDTQQCVQVIFSTVPNNDELPSREGAPGGLDRASGFPFPL